MSHIAPIGVLTINRKAKDRLVEEPAQPIYGGYANRRGEISLFGDAIVYRVNFKNNSIHQRPPLNPGAQALYDATVAGEIFEFCNVSFRRLTSAQIVDICSSGAFRIMPRLV